MNGFESLAMFFLQKKRYFLQIIMALSCFVSVKQQSFVICCMQNRKKDNRFFSECDNSRLTLAMFDSFINP